MRLSWVCVCVFQCWTHSHRPTYIKSNAQEGIVPVHSSLFHTGTGWTKPTPGPTLFVHKGAHAQTLASTQVRYFPLLDLGEIHLFSLRREIFLFHPHGVFKTSLSCRRRSSHARYSNVFNFCNSDSLKIGLHACDVWVLICRNKLVPLCLAEHQWIFLFLPHSWASSSLNVHLSVCSHLCQFDFIYYSILVNGKR